MIWLLGIGIALAILAASVAVIARFVIMPLTAEWIALQAKQAEERSGRAKIRLALLERRVASQEAKVNKPIGKQEGMPIDLLAAALSESADWAKVDRLKVLQERFEEAGDWDRVRAVISQTSN